MKKYILILLLTVAGYSYGQVKSSDFYTKQVINCDVEIDGHIVKGVFTYTASLFEINFYDENKKEYQIKKCKKDDCKIIHLELKNNLMFNSGNIIFTPNYFATPTKL